MMNFFAFFNVIFALVYINAVAALSKSTMLKLENIGMKDSRNLGLIARVFNMYGFLMCARQCEKLNQCTGFNYMRSELLCELLTSFGDVTDMAGWRFVNISSILDHSTLSTQSRGKTCKSGERNIQSSNGSFYCLTTDIPIDCGDSALMPPEAHSGIYKIKPKNGENGLKVFCNIESDGSGWTVIQNRTNGNVNFDQDWDTYKYGFGDLIGEHWIGNDALYTLTSAHNYILRIEMTTTDGEFKHATYPQFSVTNADDFFRLTVSGYTGNAIDALQHANNMRFTTKGKDHDPSPHYCPALGGGGWWFNWCDRSDLNKASSCVGCVEVYWNGSTLQLKSVTMKIKRNV